MIPGLSLLAEYPKALARIAALQVTLLDQFAIGLTGQSPLAPAPLRWRVHGTPDLSSFIEVGERCAADIATALSNIGAQFDRFRAILDFGCGCGRVLTHLRKRAPQASFYGTDIDAEAIAWCAANLNCAGFTVNRTAPPLAFDAGQFDLVYAISIFTHLDKDSQLAWLEELQRVTRPGGIVLLTLHGRHCWQALPPETIARIEGEGIAVMEEPFMKLFSPLYHTNAYHAQDYVERQFGRYFRVLQYLPRGLNQHQDIVLLEKRNGSARVLADAGSLSS